MIETKKRFNDGALSKQTDRPNDLYNEVWRMEDGFGWQDDGNPRRQKR